jgi:mRNA interferase RelE/StbE
LDVRPLVGRSGFRLRVGDWRAIYRVEGDAIEVVVIAPRGDVYDR